MINSSLYTIHLPDFDVREIINLDESGVLAEPVPVSSGEVYFLLGSMTSPFQIYKVNVSTGDKKRVNYDDIYDGDLALNTDGSRLVYVQRPSGSSLDYLSIMNDINDLNAGTSGSIYSSSRLITHASWQPAKKVIAFFELNPDFDLHYGDLFLINSDGSSLLQISKGLPMVSEDPPAWSPDGSRIVVPIKDEQGINLYIIDINNQEVKQLTDLETASYHPLWSPDGINILFMRGNQYHLISADGGGEKILSDQTPDPKFSYRTAAWSPDGNYVVLYRNRGLYIMDLTGKVIFRLVNLPSVSNISWIKNARP